jgi:hypothetical protein
MNLEITLNDGSKIFPSFDPMNKFEILKFYVELWQTKQIRNFREI